MLSNSYILLVDWIHEMYADMNVNTINTFTSKMTGYSVPDEKWPMRVFD